MVLIKSDYLEIGDLKIPPFELKKGEFVVFNLLNGFHFCSAVKYVKGLLTGKQLAPAVKVMQHFEFVERYQEPLWRTYFRPMTVASYFKKYAFSDSEYLDRFYATGFVNRRTKVCTLAGSPRKMMELCAAMSRCKCVVFDLSGVDPLGADRVCSLVRDYVYGGGTAILLDWTGDLKELCDVYVEAINE